MLSFLNRLSVRNRIWAIVVVLISGTMLGSVIDVLMLRQALWREKEQTTRQLVDAGFGLLSHLHERQRQGELSEAAAQAAAIASIRAMRYGDKEYFWLNDMGTPFPKMIMNPTVPSLDGQVLDSEQFNCATSLRVGTDGPFTSTDGKTNLFLAFSDVINRGGAGYVAYTWPKPGAGAAGERYPKLSYVRKFAPWGWVIGTGIYVDDVDAAVRALVWRNMLLVASVGLLLLLFASVLAHSITRPLHRTIRSMRSIGSDQDSLTQRLPVDDGDNEIAELAGGFNEMLARLAVRDAELAHHQEELENVVAKRTAELQDANAHLGRELAAHRQVAQALHESEEKFSRICDTAQDAIIMLDNCCNISYWNPAAEKIFGHSREAALGHDLHSLLAPERFRQAFLRGFEQFRLTGEGGAVGKTVELVGLRHDGNEFPMELSISAIHLHGDWSAVGFVRDISERKRSEQTIRENQRRMRALLDATAESVLLLDPQGVILAINACAAQRFDQQPGIMTGENFFALLPPDLAAARQAAVQHSVMTGEPVHTEDRRDNIFFDNSLYPIKDESGAVESIAVFAKDVSEQHRSKEIENIFRHLDTALLRWQMDLESIAQIFCDDILPVFDLAAAWVGRAENDGQLTLIAGADGANGVVLDPLREKGWRWDEQNPVCRLPVGAVISSSQRQTVRLAEVDCPLCDAIALATGAQVATLLPLVQRSRTWGVLALYIRDAGQFDEMHLAVVLGTIASRLGTTFEAALQQEWLTLLETALAAVENAVFITDAERKILWANRSFTNMSGYASEEILGNTPKMFSSGAQDTEFYRHFWQTIRNGGRWHGELVNARRDGQRYTVSLSVTPLLNASGNVSHYMAILEDISERKSAEERIQHLAHFDLLTDLPNRGLCFDRLGQALAIARRDGSEVALLFLDLDRFKEVNDQLGHAAGDALLAAVAQRLREQVRECDTVERLAGDEFTIILSSLRESNDATVVANKILAALAQPFTIADRQLTIGVSIGIALFPRHGETVEHLLNAADRAMYLAKNSGRNCYAHPTNEVSWPPEITNR